MNVSSMKLDTHNITVRYRIAQCGIAWYPFLLRRRINLLSLNNTLKKDDQCRYIDSALISRVN